MTHIVIHDDSTNGTQYVEFDDVQAAAAYLEDLVNQADDTNARLFALEPVEFAIKSYVRVEIGPAAAEETAVDDATVAEPVVDEAPESEPDESIDEVFTDAPVEDTVEYVDAAMVSSDDFAPEPPMPDFPEDQTAGEVRRGLFGR